MNDNRTGIVAFTKDWNDVPTCTTHILREMGKEMPVLWVNSIGTRKPDIKHPAHLKRIIQRLVGGFKRAELKENKLRVLSPLLIPKAETTIARWLNRKLFAWQVRRELRVMQCEQIEYWCFVPNAVDLLPGNTNNAKIIYYCVDDWTKFHYLDTEWIAGKERDLLRRADIVFAVSQYLVKALATRCEGVTPIYMPHGVEYGKFSRALEVKEFPDDLAGISKPVIGFYGNIYPWVDVDLVAELAKRRPQWNFVFIGGVFCDTSSLETLSNVYLLGRKEHDELPLYCAGFDVAIIPYDMKNPRMESVNPVKTRELLAAGVPIVAADVPELRGIDNVIIAGGIDEWLNGIEQQLSRDDYEKISAGMQKDDWSIKVDNIRNIVVGAVPCARPGRHGDGGHGEGRHGEGRHGDLPVRGMDSFARPGQARGGQVSARTDIIKKIALSIISIVIMFVCLELVARAYKGEWHWKNFWLAERDFVRSAYPVQFDKRLGWIPAAGASGSKNIWGSKVTIDKNSIRENGNNTTFPSRPLLLTVGDSFVFGDEVSDNETWPAYLEKELDRKVINGGVCGYGIDQSFLRLQQLVQKYKPDVILFGFTPDDIRRTGLSVYLRVPKPYFSLTGNELVLHTEHISKEKISRHDGIIRPVIGYSFFIHKIMRKFFPQYWLQGSWRSKPSGSDGLEVSRQIMKELSTIAPGVRKYIVVEYLANPTDADYANVDKVLSAVDTNVIEIIDMRNILQEIRGKDFDEFCGLYYKHMTATGNKLVAETIADRAGRNDE